MDRSVISVLNQKFDQADWEIIVVNDSGMKLSAADWHTDSRVQILETQKRERNFARNSGASIANGKYLYFLDDDDWLLPEALQHFWNLSREDSEAIWLYGGLQIVDGNENVIAEVNSGLSGNCFAQMMGGAWAPIQTSMIKADMFFHLGGFEPLIIGTEDLDLCRRAAFYGDFANTPANVACLQRGDSWATSTDYERAVEDTRYSRDMLLSSPDVIKRMFQSARSCYWWGRIFHIYLSAAKYNLTQGRYFVALSRITYGMSSFIRAWRCLPSRKYWEGVTDDHAPGTLHFVMEKWEEKLQFEKNKMREGEPEL